MSFLWTGGLFVDFSVLRLRQETVASAYPRGEGVGTPRFLASHPAIVEWRAMTVILLWVASCLAFAAR